ncbi:MAG: tetratricopeptide repeat protein [bacterium]|nr:tetratricopeptide repeat protein [bacterium]
MPIISGAARQVHQRYWIQDTIGQGGMGVVYRAYDRLTGDVVALKQVNISGSQLNERQVDYRLALAQEFRTLASLRHPHIINVLDYGFSSDGERSDRRPFYTMELLHDARPLIQAGEDLLLAQKLDLLVQILHALAYLHRRGIIHRDLKPANVMVTNHHVRLLDFGLAKHRGYLNADQVVGTLAYVAPEVLQGNPVSEGSDLYAVGVMAYELIAGHHPFDVSNITALIQQLLTSPPDLGALQVDGGLAGIIGRLMLKNPQERYQQAHEVIEALSRYHQPSPTTPVVLRESFLQAAQFVGRETELQQLTDALHQITRHTTENQPVSGSAWLIGGESGVGKTRLIEELRIQGLVEGALVLHGQAVKDGELPYQLWRAPVRRLLLAVEVTLDEAAVLQEVVPDIGALLDITVPTIPPLEGRPRQQRLLLTIADLFHRAKEPVLLLLEDLQWASPDSLESLKQLNRVVADLPPVIIANYRDDEGRQVAGELTSMRHLKLERLRPEQIVQLTESMLGSSGQNPAVIDLLQRETEGNTLFIIEVLRVLAEEAGALDRIGIKTLPSHVFAGGIVEVIRRRLARVPEDAMYLLRLAAVAGREIDLKLMRYLLKTTTSLSSDSALEAVLDVVLNRWLTFCADATVLEVQEDRWRFSHDKLRETLLADIDGDQRASLHLRIAQALEALYPHEDSRALSLAEHWYAAGNSARTIPYALKVGEQAYALSNFGEGRLWVERALRLLDEQSQPDDNPTPVRMMALSLLGDLLTRTSDYAEAVEAYEQSTALAQRLGDVAQQAEAANGLAFVAFQRSDLAALKQYSTTALALAQQANDRKNSARAHNHLGSAAEMEGQYAAARAHYEQALTIFQAISDLRGVASTLNNLGTAADSERDFAAAQRYYEDGLRVCRDIGYRHGVSVLLNNLGILTERIGKAEAAWDYLSQSLALGHIIGSRRTSAHTLTNMAFVALALDRLPESRERLRDAIRIGRQIGDDALTPHLLAVIARLHLHTGNSAHSAQIAGLIAALPDLDLDFVEIRLKPLRADLQARLSAENYALLTTQGQAFNAEQILDDFFKASG